MTQALAATGGSLAQGVPPALPLPARRSRRRSMHGHMLLAALVATATVFGLGGWSATTTISGAVIAPGRLVVASYPKVVQHPSGGIVGELHVRDGDAVREGDLLIRLDATATRANLALVEHGLDEAEAVRARFEAERAGAGAITFPPELASRRADPVVAALLAGEDAVFRMRRESLAGQRAQIAERIAQLMNEIEGNVAQLASTQRQKQLTDQELAGVAELWHKNLVPIARLTTLQRDAAKLDGGAAQLLSAVAQQKGKIAELRLQSMQLDQDLRTEATREIAALRGKIKDMAEQRITAQDQLRRIDIRAPQDGVVHQLQIHTIGGVIGQGQPILSVVPVADRLVVEARIQPQDIDQIRVGHSAVLQFPAFNRRTTPELDGEVVHISADVEVDKAGPTGAASQPGYGVRIALSDEELARLGGLRLVPGMPVEAFIKTGDRTVLSYIVKPLSDQIRHALRER